MNFISDPNIGVHNYGLTAVGEEQAKKAGLDLLNKTNLNTKIKIVASDFKRTVETAEIISSGILNSKYIY